MLLKGDVQHLLQWGVNYIVKNELLPFIAH